MSTAPCPSLFWDRDEALDWLAGLPLAKFCVTFALWLVPKLGNKVENIIRELVAYWGKVHIPDSVLKEVKQLTFTRAVELGLTIVDMPLTLKPNPGLSRQDRSCLQYVIEEGWACVANDRTPDENVHGRAELPSGDSRCFCF